MARNFKLYRVANGLQLLGEYLWQGAWNVLLVSEFTFICSEKFVLFAGKQGRERVHSFPHESMLCDLFYLLVPYRKSFVQSVERTDSPNRGKLSWWSGSVIDFSLMPLIGILLEAGLHCSFNIGILHKVFEVTCISSMGVPHLIAVHVTFWETAPPDTPMQTSGPALWPPARYLLPSRVSRLLTWPVFLFGSWILCF